MSEVRLWLTLPCSLKFRFVSCTRNKITTGEENSIGSHVPWFVWRVMTPAARPGPSCALPVPSSELLVVPVLQVFRVRVLAHVLSVLTPFGFRRTTSGLHLKTPSYTNSRSTMLLLILAHRASFVSFMVFSTTLATLSEYHLVIVWCVYWITLLGQVPTCFLHLLA